MLMMITEGWLSGAMSAVSLSLFPQKKILISFLSFGLHHIPRSRDHALVSPPVYYTCDSYDVVVVPKRREEKDGRWEINFPKLKKKDSFFFSDPHMKSVIPLTIYVLYNNYRDSLYYVIHA
jgi:hypothetical protein